MKEYVFCSECKYYEECSVGGEGVLAGCVGYSAYAEVKKFVKSNKEKIVKSCEVVKTL
jgi:hypothetical protein